MLHICNSANYVVPMPEENVEHNGRISAETDFMSLVSHQLRTPLGVIKWSVELLRRGDALENHPEIVTYVDRIYDNNDRALSLINNLLLASRIDQGRTTTNPQQVDLVDLISEVTAQLAAKIDKQKLTLSLQSPDQLIASIDAAQFKDVLQILILNAVFYNREHGTIDVTLTSQPDSFTLSVKDTGIGFHDEDKKHVFKKFFRAESAKKYHPTGLGLGLFVVKSYVDSWRGQVLFSSSLGAGSTFTITVPLTSSGKYYAGLNR